MYYGGTQADKLQRRYRRFYAADGTMEITFDALSNKTTFVTYMGGDAYGAPAVWHSEQTSATTEQYFYLFRDYLGSIMAITDSAGVIKEKRIFDAWGELVKLTDGNNNVLTNFTVLDRGYTGHEHLLGVGLVHMNGRLYDPKLHRFLMPDNFVQDPYNTQNFNRYGYVLNNPLSYTDSSGEFAWFVFAAAALLGAYSGGVIANGGQFNPGKWDWGSGKTWGFIFAGALIGGASASIATSISSSIAASAINYAGLIGSATGGLVGGALAGGGFSLLSGGSLLDGVWKGAISGMVGAAIGSYIGGGIGALSGGASAGVVGVTLNKGSNFGDILKGGLIGGVVSYGLYNLSLKLSYSKFKNDGGEWSYKQFRKISAAAQRSFTRTKLGREYGGWLLKNGDVEMWPIGGNDGIDPTPKPDNAIGEFHTHPGQGKFNIFKESHSGKDKFGANEHFLRSYVVSYKNNIFQYSAFTRVSVLQPFRVMPYYHNLNLFYDE